MICNIVLDEKEIEEILAKHYGVEKLMVALDTFTESVGYGPNEHDEVRVKAVVHIPWKRCVFNGEVEK